MKKVLNLFGIGPRLIIFTLLYSFLFEKAKQLYHFDISIKRFVPNALVNIVSIILIMLGLVFLILSLRAIIKLTKADKLNTNGIYSVCRHPLYTSWIIFIVPGIILMSNSLASFSIPLIMYLIFRLLIKEEENKLLNRYGDQYRDYKSRVGLLFPKIWRFKNARRNNQLNPDI